MGVNANFINSETADQFVDQIFRKGDADAKKQGKEKEEDGGGTIDVQELVDIMSNDLCNFETLKKHVEAEDQAEKSKMAGGGGGSGGSTIAAQRVQPLSPDCYIETWRTAYQLERHQRHRCG